MRAMNRLGSALAAVALTAATAAAFAGPASAATARDSFPGAGHAVFVQTDNTAGKPGRRLPPLRRRQADLGA